LFPVFTGRVSSLDRFCLFVAIFWARFHGPHLSFPVLQVGSLLWTATHAYTRSCPAIPCLPGIHFLFSLNFRCLDRIYRRPMSSMDPWRSVSAPYRRLPTPVINDTIMPNSLPASFPPHIPQFPFIASNSDSVFHPNSNLLPSPNHQFRLNSPIFNRELPPNMRSYSPLARNLPSFHSIHQYPTSNFAHVRNISTSNPHVLPLQPFTSANILHLSPFPPALTHSFSVDIKPISIPALSHIPILKSRQDFAAWEGQVLLLLQTLDIYGHILDPATPILLGMHYDKVPSIMPVLSPNPSKDELLAWKKWRLGDAAVCQILMARLSDTVRSLLPPAVAPSSTRTAYLTYKCLSETFGVRSFVQCTDLVNKLFALHCAPSKVNDYVNAWSAGVTKLVSIGFPGSMRLYISVMIQGLPDNTTFSTMKTNLAFLLDTMCDNDINIFHSICNDI